MHKRILVAGICLLVLGLISFLPFPFHSESQGNGYDNAVVTKVHHAQGQTDTVTIVLKSGPDHGKTAEATIGALTTSVDITPPSYKPGDKVIVNHGAVIAGEPSYVIIDQFRLPLAAWLLALVIALAIVFAGWRGIGSVAGLLLSLFIVGKFVIPAVLSGHNPYVVTGLGIVVISLLGIFLAHGFKKRTALALAGTYITLLVAVGFSFLVVSGLHLTGISNEDIFYLGNKLPGLPIHGLLLCGMLLSIVGILDDMTVGQATSVEELHKANPSLGFRELYSRSLMIGREHIASLINTLILAFVGTSFLYIIYISATTPYPLLVNLNSEQVMEEIARSLVGSVALILAVPITTLLAARFLRTEQEIPAPAHKKTTRHK